MKLSEKHMEINHVTMREIRKLNDNGHQTSVITTKQKLSVEMVALYTFSRWSQENFFRYMRQEYDMDKIIQYGVDELDEDILIVNREYSNLTYKLKRVREKISRRQAHLFILKEENTKAELEQSEKYLQKQLKISEELNILQEQEKELIEKRKQHPYKIPISQMPQDQRYNKLKPRANIYKTL